MKHNFIILIFAIISVILSLLGYCLFMYVPVQPIVTGKDICMAIFSSSIFVIITAIVGILNERRNLLIKILTETKNLQVIYDIANETQMKNGIYSLDRIEIQHILKSQINKSDNIIILVNEFPNTKCQNLKNEITSFQHYIYDELKKVLLVNEKEYKFDIQEFMDKNDKITKIIFSWLSSYNIKI